MWKLEISSRNWKMENRKKQKTAQEIQDEIFRRISASKKIKLASELTMFCLKLNQLNNGRNKSRKTSS